MKQIGYLIVVILFSVSELFACPPGLHWTVQLTVSDSSKFYLPGDSFSTYADGPHCKVTSPLFRKNQAHESSPWDHFETFSTICTYSSGEKFELMATANRVRDTKTLNFNPADLRIYGTEKNGAYLVAFCRSNEFLKPN